MIEITNNTVIITIDNTHLVQKYDPETGVFFQSREECFNWIVASGWFDRFKKAAIKIIKERATKKLHAEVPNHKQINASLGIYSRAECKQIAKTIEKYRSQANTTEQTVLAATTLEEIKSLISDLPVVATISEISVSNS